MVVRKRCVCAVVWYVVCGGEEGLYVVVRKGCVRGGEEGLYVVVRKGCVRGGEEGVCVWW